MQNVILYIPSISKKYLGENDVLCHFYIVFNNIKTKIFDNKMPHNWHYESCNITKKMKIIVYLAQNCTGYTTINNIDNGPAVTTTYMREPWFICEGRFLL